MVSERCPSRFKCTLAALTLTCIKVGAVTMADAQGYVFAKTQDMGCHNQHCPNRTADFSQVDTTLWLWMTTAISVIFYKAILAAICTRQCSYSLTLFIFKEGRMSF